MARTKYLNSNREWIYGDTAYDDAALKARVAALEAQQRVSSVNGRTGAVSVREVPDHGVLGQVLTVTGTDTYDWQSLPVWDGTVE